MRQRDYSLSLSPEGGEGTHGKPPLTPSPGYGIK